jgi:cell division protein FtsB
MGRPPIGKRAMSGAERTRRHRAKLKPAAKAARDALKAENARLRAENARLRAGRAVTATGPARRRTAKTGGKR